MADSRTNHLKLYTEQAPPCAPPDTPLQSLSAVLEAFRQATGWSLQYDPSSSGPVPRGSAPVRAADAAVGHLVLSPAKGHSGAVADLERIRPLTVALGAMVGEMLRLQEALWQREAELAAGVPLVPARDEQQHLARRLEAVLKGGAEAIGCQAAGLYLLDEGTSELKLRSCWGLPRQRLLDPARPLRGAMADLEAMLGHAVVLDEAVLMEHWAAPEPFGAAVCVPVATATTILGTLWIYSDQRRTFDDGQTNIVEMVAGRLAADLEREMLLQEGIEGARLKRQLNAAQQLQQDQTPHVAPDVDGWELWGCNPASQSLNGQFYDWFCQSDGTVGAVLGSAVGRPIEAAITAGSLRSSIRAHGQYHAAPDAVLAQASRTLWTTSAGDQHASACYAACQPDSNRVLLSMAGSMAAFLLDEQGVQRLTWESPRLGEDPAVMPECRELTLNPGQTLIAVNLESPVPSPGPRAAPDATRLGEALSAKAGSSVRELVDAMSDFLRTTAPPGSPGIDIPAPAVLAVRYQGRKGKRGSRKPG